MVIDSALFFRGDRRPKVHLKCDSMVGNSFRNGSTVIDRCLSTYSAGNCRGHQS